MFGRKKPEVLVAGAGPVGLFTALALRNRGVKVRVVDKGRQHGTRSYALALHANSLSLLERYGLLPEICGRSRRVRSVGLYDEQERRAELRVADLAEDHSFLAVLKQADLEEVLESALEAAGVHILWNHQLAAVTPREDDVLVDMERLSLDTLGYSVQYTDWVVSRMKPLEVPFVVGADGHASRVRRSLEIEFPSFGEPDDFAVFEFKTDFDIGDEMRVVFGDDATSACWPLPGGIVRWSFQIPRYDTRADSREKERSALVDPSQFPILSDDRLREFLAQRAPWFDGQVESMRWSRVVRFDRRLVESFGERRVWLVGDATHLTGPVGIQSMNVGLQEAEELAEHIAGVARRRKPPVAFAAYTDARHVEWRQLLGLEGGLEARADTDPWIVGIKDRLLPCVPAAGEDLERLVGQVGLDIRAPRVRAPGTPAATETSGETSG